MKDILSRRPSKVEAIAAVDNSTEARRARMRAHDIPTMPEIEERGRLRARRKLVQIAAGLAVSATIATAATIGAVNILEPGRHDSIVPNSSPTEIVVYHSSYPENQGQPLDPLGEAEAIGLFLIIVAGALVYHYPVHKSK
jgi:hypothetical protein